MRKERGGGLVVVSHELLLVARHGEKERQQRFALKLHTGTPYNVEGKICLPARFGIGDDGAAFKSAQRLDGQQLRIAGAYADAEQDAGGMILIHHKNSFPASGPSVRSRTAASGVMPRKPYLSW